MSVHASFDVILTLIVLVLVAWLLRWTWHRHIGTPLDPEAERERLRQDIARSYRIGKRITKWYLRRQPGPASFFSRFHSSI